ncbi:4'-phosphopantetheinyl transferase [Cognatishimia sp.]|uniref:4'-phosphopantetheinyl transferase family protein n=1 Tax=Cognatishimia sp. TaxID=2211648 RepID=UPI00351301F2|nr:4'-phosphopantetheinyl transferase superfamily protein [Cognatishimia sp.]
MTMMMRHNSRLELAARAVLPTGVAVSVTSPTAEPDPLWPVEEQAISKAVPARQREFAAGRMAARRALLALGRAPSAIPVGDDRAPIWPRAIVGSIAHDETACIAVTAERDRFKALGVDIEPSIPVEAELFQEICRPEELAWLRQLPFESRGMVARRFFAAKEAVYKCQYTISRKIFGFDSLSVVFDRQGRFDARLMKEAGPFETGTIFKGMTALVGDQILSLCWIGEGHHSDEDFQNSVTG